LKLQTKEVALIAAYAALYAVLVNVIPGLSFGAIQLRIADCMVAAIPLLGIAGVLGHTLGVFIGNIPSPLGPIDLLNTVPSFAMALVVFYVYRKTRNDYTVIGTCTAYSAILGITVGYMLSFILSLPLLATIVYVFIGNFIASVLIGWPLFKLLKKTGVQRWLGTEVEKR
jgi:uncharacterized membrane protein